MARTSARRIGAPESAVVTRPAIDAVNGSMAGCGRDGRAAAGAWRTLWPNALERPPAVALTAMATAMSRQCDARWSMAVIAA
jgi:hypothetical protein